jgi:hypothetical protein
MSWTRREPFAATSQRAGSPLSRHSYVSVLIHVVVTVFFLAHAFKEMEAFFLKIFTSFHHHYLRGLVVCTDPDKVSVCTDPDKVSVCTEPDKVSRVMETAKKDVVTEACNHLAVPARRTLGHMNSATQSRTHMREHAVQARLLVMRAARMIDEHGAKGARNEIAYIKAVVPMMAQQVIDRAIQAHGAAGVLVCMFVCRQWRPCSERTAMNVMVCALQTCRLSSHNRTCSVSMQRLLRSEVRSSDDSRPWMFFIRNQAGKFH